MSLENLKMHSIDATQGKVQEPGQAPSQEPMANVSVSTPATADQAANLPSYQAVNGAKLGNNLQTIDPTQILPRRTPPATTNDASQYAALDEALARTKAQTTQILEDLEERQYKADMEANNQVEGITPAQASGSAVTNSTTPAAAEPQTQAVKIEDIEEDELVAELAAARQAAIGNVKHYNMFEADGNSDSASQASDSTIPEPMGYNNNSANNYEPVVDVEEEPVENPMPIIHTQVSTNYTEPAADEGNTMDEILEQKTTDTDERKIMQALKDTTIEVLGKPAQQLNGFKISKKAVSITKAIARTVVPTNVADWVLLNTGRPISMSGLSGPEILKLNPSQSDRSRLNTFRDIYTILYTHDISPNKLPFEAWMRSIKYNDIDHLYFSAYMATFAGSNHIHYICPDDTCRHVFLEKNIKFDKMVKYDNDKTKKAVGDLLRKDINAVSDEYTATMVPISKNYAIALRVPSIWNIIIENASLTEAFIQKYSELTDIVSYVEDVYLINYDTKEYEPVDLMTVENDQAASTANRIRIIYQILQSLTSDEYFDLVSSIKNIEDTAGVISYQIPEAVCPVCGKKIEAVEQRPEELLFMRHRLGLYKTMSIL